MTDNNDKKETSEISEEMSKRVCSHMNEDHSVSVFCMARALLGGGDGVGKITDAKLKSVNFTGCEMSVVTCKGDMCKMQKMTYPFEPPLANSSEVRPRMVEIHKKVCAPRISWLFTNGTAFAALVACALLGFATHVIGISALVESIEGAPQFNNVISSIFGSAEFFGTCVFRAWILAVVLHNLEALYVVYHAKMTLKMGVKAQFLWYIVCASVGYPMTKEFLTLKNMQDSQKSKK